MILSQTSKNFMINADFAINQRGTTSVGLGTAATWVADRWRWLVFADGGTAATGTISRTTIATSTPPAEYYQSPHFIRIAPSSQGSGLGAGSYAYLGQRVENSRLFAGKKVTLSVWAASTAARTFNVGVIREYGIGGSTTEGVAGGQFTVLDSTIRRYDVVLNIPTIAGKTFGTGSNMLFSIIAQQGASDAAYYNGGLSAMAWPSGNPTVDIYRVALTVGDTTGASSNDFVLAGGGDYISELTYCQRFYEKSYDPDVAPGTNTTTGAATVYNYVNSTQNPGGFVWYKVPKRANPTVAMWTTGGSVDGTSTSRSSKDYFMRINNVAANSFVDFHWSADAEI